jgi:hypothetical protein
MLDAKEGGPWLSRANPLRAEAPIRCPQSQKPAAEQKNDPYAYRRDCFDTNKTQVHRPYRGLLLDFGDDGVRHGSILASIFM